MKLVRLNKEAYTVARQLAEMYKVSIDEIIEMALKDFASKHTISFI